MNRDGHDSVAFFVGDEVEHTPAHGKKTLFVVGVHAPAAVSKYLDNNLVGIEHIYFGANQSFPNLRATDGGEWAKWETMIYHFLDKQYWCTLDIDIACVEGLVESGLCENNKFIPMISAKLPYVGLLGYNATIKLDDTDFNHSNPGVWCHSVHALLERKVFTPWDHYTKDQPL
jgi:hypothetical protein